MFRKRYYKVLDKDMKSSYQKFQYELGKKYKIDRSEVIPYISGFNACVNLYGTILYTNKMQISDCRIFECKLGRKTKYYSNGYGVCSDSITLIKEVPFEEVDKSIRDNIVTLLQNCNTFALLQLVNSGYILDKLVTHKNPVVRAAAMQRRINQAAKTSN